MLLMAMAVLCASAAGPALHAGLVDAPGVEARNSLDQVLHDAGYAVRTVDYDALCSPAALDDLDLLVIPRASRLPIDAAPVIDAYLRRGGDLIALDAPLWRTPLVRDAEGWVDRDRYRRNHEADLMESTLFAFTEASDLAGWQRSTSNPGFSATHRIEADATAPDDAALRVTIEDIDSWDTFMSPDLDSPFPVGHTLTVFYAKGDANTPSLSVEWTETDGSRWIAVVPLSAEWRMYVLQPVDFAFWESVPARKDTEFNPANANQLRIGLAFSHTPMPGGTHTYWVGPIGTAPRTPESEPLLTDFAPPKLEILSPNYKYFPCGEVATLVRGETLAPAPSGVIRSPHPRPSAAGFDKGRVWRFEPLLEARAADGAWRGTPAAVLVHADGPYRGGVWAAVGIEDEAWYASEDALALVKDVASRMHTGLFLLDGGSAYYTHFPDQAVTAGARVVNVAEAAHDVSLTVSLEKDGVVLRRETRSLHIPAMGADEVRVAWPALSPEDKCVTVRVELAWTDRLVDTVAHDIHAWRPKADPEYMTVEHGEFMLNGERWRAHGVNYMPSSGIGLDEWYPFEHWIGARAYDPAVIQRDLDHIVDMGLNSVSIFIYRESLEAQNLLDLLRRIDAMGLKANLSLRPGTPLDFEWEKMRELLTHYRIAEHDCVFALDLAWEPMFPDHEGRTRHDSAWRAWIDERYGSTADAEKDWGFTAPRDADGAVTNPTDIMVTEDGPWRVMAAAYRRFLDTLLYEHYSRARTLVRSIDPHHPVSFRMTEAGNPTFRGTSVLPYDYPQLAAAVDILEPEAYGRIGNWERVKPALFQAAYGRWAAPHVPFLWAEAGVHVWDMRAEAPLPERLDFQAEYYGHFYRMLIESGADGIFWWWYPGGFRVNERSDYGIINSDGSDRPVTRIIRDHARKFLDGPAEPAPDVWLTMDRDAHPAGVPGIYAALEDEYWRLREAGRVPGLRTDGTGTTSADCPRVAVGNVPLTGANPPKYLDAFIDAIEILASGGVWRGIEPGEVLEASEGSRIRLTITNLGEATWLARAGSGQVTLQVSPDDVHVPLPRDVARFDTIVLEFPLPERAGSELRLVADGIGPFGSRASVATR